MYDVTIRVDAGDVEEAILTARDYSARNNWLVIAVVPAKEEA